MNFNKTSEQKGRRRGLWIALSSLCLTGLFAYLCYFISFHLTFDPYLKENAQKQVMRLSNIEDLALRDTSHFVMGHIYENDKEAYFFLFYGAGPNGPLLTLEEKKGEERLYQAQWNGETEASEFHYIEGANVEKTFKTLTYKELLATFMAFPLDPDQFSYQSRMKSLSFNRKENWAITEASYLPEEDWCISLPKMGVAYSLANLTFEFSFHPMDEYLDGNGVFGFHASGMSDGAKVDVVYSFYRGDYQKTLS